MMKQVIQSFRTGKLAVSELPAPGLRPRGILVRTAASLISTGTERTALSFAAKNLLQKARARPDLVQQLLQKIEREGLGAALDSARSRLEKPLPLGYSSAGTVVAVGAEAGPFRVGERVACAGGGYASHAEIVYVPRNLAVKLPDGVSFEGGSFVTLGSVALQAIRQSEAVLGNSVAVIGLGLLGQLTVQLLKAAGCRVFGVDLLASRVSLARSLGADAACLADNAADRGLVFTAGHGFDQVLITADTPGDEPVILAGELARDRGIVVVAGAVGMEVPRKAYYEKELELRLSRSYGPGRYDPEYEESGHDYPYGYVRWTEKRNMEAFVSLLEAGRIHIEPLITGRFDLEHAMEAYDVVARASNDGCLGIVLLYPQAAGLERRVFSGASDNGVPQRGSELKSVSLGVVGAGAFATSTLLPLVCKMDNLDLVGIAALSGVTSRAAADRFGFRYCTSDFDQLLEDDSITTVAILTRHNQHAHQVAAALEAGKHVFVEKPLALDREELEVVEMAHQLAWERAGTENRRGPMLMVGYNRRFAPFVAELKNTLGRTDEPLLINIRVNGGSLPPPHWLTDPNVGGGRLLGEGCHFIDLLLHLAPSPAVAVTTRALAGRSSSDGSFVSVVEFADGTLGTLTYSTGGSRNFPKELVEVFGGGMAARIDDFRSLQIRGTAGQVRRTARWKGDKGHRAEWQAIAAHLIEGAPAPIAIDALFASARATLAAQESMLTGETVRLGASL